MLLVFVGMSTVALMALPVEPGIPVVGGQNSGFGTELGGKFVEAPVLGRRPEPHHRAGSATCSATRSRVVATLVLIQAANAGMVGITRTSYMLATHRQIPRGLARLHPRYTTPWIVISISSVLVFLLLLPVDIELLAGMFAYGALIAFCLAHLSVCALRFKEPDRRRPFKVPLNVRMRGRELPLPAALGAVLSFAAWVGVLDLPRRGALLRHAPGCCSGVGLYVIYRSRQGLSLTRMVEVSPTTLASAGARGRVRQHPGAGLRRAARRRHHEHGRAARRRGGRGRQRGRRVIEAIYVTEVPMSLPLDARLPKEKVERGAPRACAREADRRGVRGRRGRDGGGAGSHDRLGDRRARRAGEGWRRS